MADWTLVAGAATEWTSGSAGEGGWALKAAGVQIVWLAPGQEPLVTETGAIFVTEALSAIVVF